MSRVDTPEATLAELRATRSKLVVNGSTEHFAQWLDRRIASLSGQSLPDSAVDDWKAARLAAQKSHTLDGVLGGIDLDVLDKAAVVADERRYLERVQGVRDQLEASAGAPVARREYLHARLTALALVRHLATTDTERHQYSSGSVAAHRSREVQAVMEASRRGRQRQRTASPLATASPVRTGDGGVQRAWCPDPGLAAAGEEPQRALSPGLPGGAMASPLGVGGSSPPPPRALKGGPAVARSLATSLMAPPSPSDGSPPALPSPSTSGGPQPGIPSPAPWAGPEAAPPSLGASRPPVSGLGVAHLTPPALLGGDALPRTPARPPQGQSGRPGPQRASAHKVRTSKTAITSALKRQKAARARQEAKSPVQRATRVKASVHSLHVIRMPCPNHSV